MEREVIAKERWSDATIRDNFVFSKTMEMYTDLCRQLLELILRLKIREINYPEREKTIEACIDGKGIRLDVYVEDKTAQRSFDVEMQLTDSANLAKRMRYYQGLIDIDKLKSADSITAHWANRSSFSFAPSTDSSWDDTSTRFKSGARKIRISC